MKRHVYMISDGTGITVEGLGNSLLTQFEDLKFEKKTISYIDSEKKAYEIVDAINRSHKATGVKPLVFMTLINKNLSDIIKTAHGCIYDFFQSFITKLEVDLAMKSSDKIGKTHGVINDKRYSNRIEAIEYTLSHDDGLKTKDYEVADIILIGVSRCGKTPSCIYLALQYGLLAANYPFTEEDLDNFRLPKFLRLHKKKIVGITISCDRLQQIRQHRRPDSFYSSYKQCRLETSEVEAMYKAENIPFIDSTRCSIEEIATKVITLAKLKRKI